MTQGSSSNRTEFADQTTLKSATTTATLPKSNSTITSKRDCDILLNNFQIKKKRYRVLFNCDHIVWERLEAKRSGKNVSEKLTKKDVEIEKEQLSNKAAYGDTTNVVHMNEIIKVAKGDSKSATFRNTSYASDNFTKLTVEHNVPSSSSSATPSSSTPPTEQYLSIHYAERIIKSETDCNRWHVHTLTLFNADPYIVRQWHTVLSETLNDHCSNATQRMRVQRLLVFINPYGGRKQGLHVYERFCKPLFQLADIDASCIVSQRSNQIRDILVTYDLSPFDAVCCVGGDGTVAEVINGLVFRAIRDLGMDVRRPAFIPKPQLPIAIIPAGSTDTVAYSLHGTADARTAAIHLVMGQRRGMDVCSVRNRQGVIRFCASVLSYGYLGDVAAKSEMYRWMGTKRYEYTGVKAFLSNRGYDAEIRLLLQQNDLGGGSSDSAQTGDANNYCTNGRDIAETICYANCQRCVEAQLSCRAVQCEQSFSDMNCVGDDDELPTSSNLSLYAQKSTDDNVSDVTKSTNVENKLCSIYQHGEEISDEVDNIKNLNCDENLKPEQQTEKVKQIKKLPTNDSHNDDDDDTEHQPKSGEVNSRTEPAIITANTCISIGSNSSISNDNCEKSTHVEPANSQQTAAWKTITGKFFMISGVNITCACSRSPNGISRYSHLGDGYLDLILVRKTSLLNNIRFVINTMGRNGDIRNLPFVEIYRTKQFSFRTPQSSLEEDYSITGSCQPITEAVGPNGTNEADDDNSSRWNCDGEVVTDLDILMSSHCQLIDVFMRGPSAYSKPLTITEKHSCFECCKSEN